MATSIPHFAIRLMTTGIFLVSVAQQVAGQTVSPFPLANLGFEGTYTLATECTNVTGEVANGWNDNTCWDDKRPVLRYAKDNENPHSGASSQKITLVSGSRVQFTQAFSLPFEIGKRYRVSVWMRAQAPMFVTIFLRRSGPPYTGYTSKLTKLSTTWTRFEMDGATDGSGGGLFILTDSPGTFWIDDVSAQSETLVASNPTPPLTAVPRGYFGMHLNKADTAWPRVSNAIGSVRMWDAGKNYMALIALMLARPVMSK
jgi:hypothetical protein